MTEAKGIQKADVLVKRITIRNFRGIQYLDLRLQPGLTLLAGRNNAGKSGILYQQLGLSASSETETLKLMKSNKSSIGAFLAEEFIKTHPYSSTGSQWPEPLRELVDKLRHQLTDSNKGV